MDSFRIPVSFTTVIEYFATAAGRIADYVVRTHGYFAVSARNIENVSRLAQSRQPPAQRTHQCLTDFDRNAEMRRARRQIRMVQVIGTHLQTHEPAEQSL